MRYFDTYACALRDSNSAVLNKILPATICDRIVPVLILSLFYFSVVCAHILRLCVSNQKMEKKQIFRRLRFQYEDEVALLREFISVNPITNPLGWEIIQEHLYVLTGKKFLVKTLKAHLLKLLDEFLKKVVVDQVRSGVEEAQTERGTLLQEVQDLCREHNYTFKQPRKASSKYDKVRELGKDLRDKYALKLEQSQQPNITELNEHEYCLPENVPVASEIIVSNENEDESQMDILKTSLPPSPRAPSPKNGPEFVPGPSATQTKANVNKVLGPIRRRVKREPIRQNALGYLRDKAAEENIIKKKQIELEERKLALQERKIALEETKAALEEKRFEMECKERVERIELEKKRIYLDLEERKNTNQLLKSQQIIIDNLLKHFFMVNNVSG